jgi:putative transposase
VAYGRERGLSARRAFTLFSVARSALGYRGRKLVKDAPAMARMRALSAEYPRYGATATGGSGFFSTAMVTR